MSCRIALTQNINLLNKYINKIKELNDAITILDKYGKYRNFICAIQMYMEIINNPIIHNNDLDKHINMIIEQLEEKLTILIETCL